MKSNYTKYHKLDWSISYSEKQFPNTFSYAWRIRQATSKHYVLIQFLLFLRSFALSLFFFFLPFDSLCHYLETQYILFLIRCLWDLTDERLAVKCVNASHRLVNGLLEYFYGAIRYRGTRNKKFFRVTSKARNGFTLADLLWYLFKCIRFNSKLRENNLVMQNDKLFIVLHRVVFWRISPPCSFFAPFLTKKAEETYPINAHKLRKWILKNRFIVFATAY